MGRRPTPRITMQEVERLSYRNLVVDAADHIRRLLLSGQFPPGTHILEADLASALGVSHGTVRSGLLQLRYEGLVEHHPNRGVFARCLGSRDAREIYTLRNTLEAMAARLVAERVTEDALQELRAILEQMRKTVEAGDRQASIRTDFEFHRRVMALSNHRLLQEHYRLLDLQTQLFMALTDILHPDLSHMMPLHEPLFEAIAAGDTDRAEALAATHNNADGERLFEDLKRVES